MNPARIAMAPPPDRQIHGPGMLAGHVGPVPVAPAFPAPVERPVADRTRLLLEGPIVLTLLRLSLVNNAQANLTVLLLTGLVGPFGTTALADYGMGARLEYLQIPPVFGVGSALVTMVGTNVGAGRHARAERIAWTGAGMAAVLTGAIGLPAALFPHTWLGLFGGDPDVLHAGAAYLRVVGPAYGFFGLGLALCFASQGTGRLFWPVLAGFSRLVIAGVGGWLVIYWVGGGLTALFGVMALALVAFGVILAAAVRSGAWRGTPWSRDRHV